MLTEDEVREAAAQFAARAIERDRHRVRRERAEQDRRVRMARKARVRVRASGAGGTSGRTSGWDEVTRASGERRVRVSA